MVQLASRLLPRDVAVLKVEPVVSARLFERFQRALEATNVRDLTRCECGRITTQHGICRRCLAEYHAESPNRASIRTLGQYLRREVTP